MYCSMLGMIPVDDRRALYYKKSLPDCCYTVIMALANILSFNLVRLPIHTLPTVMACVCTGPGCLRAAGAVAAAIASAAAVLWT